MIHWLYAVFDDVSVAAIVLDQTVVRSGNEKFLKLTGTNPFHGYGFGLWFRSDDRFPLPRGFRRCWAFLADELAICWSRARARRKRGSWPVRAGASRSEAPAVSGGVKIDLQKGALHGVCLCPQKRGFHSRRRTSDHKVR